MIPRDHVLQFCAALSWAPGLHKYDMFRAALTVGYATTAVLAGLRWRQSRAWIWAFVALYMVLLALNRQLDLQTFVTQTARCIARNAGWYRQRRGPQAELTYAVLGLMAAGFAATLILTRRFRILMTGLVLVTADLCLRMLSFHATDRLLQAPVFSLPLHGYIEAFGLGLTIYAAVRQV